MKNSIANNSARTTNDAFWLSVTLVTMVKAGLDAKRRKRRVATKVRLVL